MTRIGIAVTGLLAIVLLAWRRQRRRELAAGARPTDVSSHRILGYAGADTP